MSLRRNPPPKRRRRPTPGTSAERAAFREATLTWAGRACVVTDDGYHEGDLQAHHVIAQEEVKQRAATLGIEGAELAALLWDPDNGMCVCRRHHDRHTLASRRLPRYALTLENRDFAESLGVSYQLDRYYREEGDRQP